MKYIEISQQLIYYSVEKLKEKLRHYENAIDEWALIVHDKDTLADGSPKATHFHCVIKFNVDSYTLERIAKMFEVEEQQLSYVKSYNNKLSYLCHRTDNARKKYQYPIEDVTSNFDYGKRLESITNEVNDAKSRQDEIEKMLVDFATFKLSRNKLVSNLNPLEYDKYKRKIDNMSSYRNEIVKKEDRKMRVLYITGASESGKTTLAKYISATNGYDFFVTGSGSDILDGYDNEECIIFDDLRADTFKKWELFKLFDNNTGSAVKSRYYNKAINHCKLAIITSVYPPNQLYDWFDDKKVETAKQFARRLNYVSVVINPDGRVFERKLSDKLDPSGDTLAPFNMQTIYASLGIMKNQQSCMDLLMKVANTVDTPF